ncbi:MAG TPA: protein kinase [Polyangiales bacterium]|nr:protein kinase [Polyangiales bacterium]
MSDNHSAKNDDIDVDVEQGEEADESIVADRSPRAPSIQRLGRYRLVREIASGGMATVNLAVTEGLDKLVALKIIHPHLAQEESFVRMFLDEARLSSAISHRNVCNVFDFGEADGRFYIAMDYLSGQSLRDVLRRLRKTDLQMEPRKLAVYVAYMTAEACEGLHAAHELHNSEGKPLNVVHRDVSPHNLFVTYDGNVSVVDFGIARASDRIQSTATGVLKGKFSYMAPEQMRQLEIDRRADIWALGVVLWESLTLQRLFVRSSQADTVMSVMMDRVRPPSELKPDIPRELDTIALKAIARNPAQRYTTAREMGRELMKFCRESGVMVGPIEIEHMMEKLFEKEIQDNKTLTRKAKSSGQESGVWMDVTPSGFGRVRSSGAMEKGKWTTNPPSANVVVGDGTGSTAMRIQAGSLSAPAIEARTTAHPDVTNAPQQRKKPVMWIGAVAAAALALAVWGVARRTDEPAIASVPPAVTPVTPEPQLGVQAPPSVQPQPALPEAAQQRDAAAPEMAPPPTSVPARAQPLRRAPAPRPVARAAGPNHAREADASPSSEYVRYEEPSPMAAPVEAREEPTAMDTATAAPARVEQPAPTPKPVAATPAAPQKLDARASVEELDVEGSLGSSIVSRMLARVMPALKSCYVDAAKKANRNEYGALASSFVIEEMGAVRQVNVGRSGLADLSSCVAATLKRARPDRVPDVGTVQVKFKITYAP